MTSRGSVRVQRSVGKGFLAVYVDETGIHTCKPSRSDRSGSDLAIGCLRWIGRVNAPAAHVH